jgi:hypothetical protein
MDLTPYVENLRRELAVAADAGGDDVRALAERLTAPLESAVRLMLLDALSAAGDPEFVVPATCEHRSPRVAAAWRPGCAHNALEASAGRT